MSTGRRWLAASLAASVGIGALILTTDTAGAVSGTCYFGGGTCSITDYGKYGVNDVLTGRSTNGTGLAIGTGVDTKAKFITNIANRMNGSKQDKVGAAMIITAMTGTSRTRSPSATTIDQWKQLMGQSNVTFHSFDGTVTSSSWYTPAGDGNVFFASRSSTQSKIIEIRQNGRVLLKLRRECGNPTVVPLAITPPPSTPPPGDGGGGGGDPGDPGGPDTPPPPPPWYVTGAASVSHATARPGQMVTWNHRLQLFQNSNDQVISYRTVLSGFSVSGWNGNQNSNVVGIGRAPGTIVSLGGSEATRTSHRVGQDDVGNQLCQRIRWQPSAHNNSSAQETPQACVEVPYVYELTPIMVDAPQHISDSADVLAGVSARVNNSGPTKSQVPVRYGLSQFVVRRGTAVPVAGGMRNAVGLNWDGCGVFSGEACRLVRESTVGFIGLGAVEIANEANDLGGLDLSLGDRVCYIVFVNRYTQGRSAADYRYSAPRCAVVAKSPKVQFWGADVRSGGRIDTRITAIPEVSGGGRTYGSWAEYALSASGVISRYAASGAGMSSVDGRTYPVAEASHHRLTFANEESTYGRFSAVTPTIVVPPEFVAPPGSPTLDGTVVLDDTDAGRYLATSDVVIAGGRVDREKSIIIDAAGRTVRISGDVRYDDTSLYRSMLQLPHLVIRAAVIEIDPSVTHVDAWLIASDRVSTCGTPGVSNWLSGVSGSGACSTAPLRVNGPIMTPRLLLRRAFGSERETRNVPAEILNLRPDTYLWSRMVATQSDPIGTMHIREMPPRY